MKYLSALLSTVLILPGTMVMAEESPVAEVYGEKVYAHDLQLPAEEVKMIKSTMSTEDFAQWERDAPIEVLSYKVMEQARKHFLKAMGMEPTQQDIDGYIAFLHRTRQAEYQGRAEQREKLQKQLQQPELADELRAAAKSSLSVLDELDKYDSSPSTDTERKEQQDAEQTVASMMVASWKFNQALYRKYAGRVVFQQAGLEPIDAHKAFMQELDTSGAYKILDPKYRDLFKETNEYFDKKFEYVDQAEADKYFSAPWWLHETEVK